MSTANHILSGIEAAQAAVRQAALQWDATNLAQVQASLIALEGSLPRLKSSLDAIPNAGQLPATKLRDAAKLLRHDASALEFLVDAAAAYIRATPAGVIANQQTYNPTGQLRLDFNSSTDSYTA